MKVARVKVVLVDSNWKIVKMRTAFEHNAQELADGLVSANPGYLSRIDSEGDYIVYPPPVDPAPETVGPPARAARQRSARLLEQLARRR